MPQILARLAVPLLALTAMVLSGCGGGSSAGSSAGSVQGIQTPAAATAVQAN